MKVLRHCPFFAENFKSFKAQDLGTVITFLDKMFD